MFGNLKVRGFQLLAMTRRVLPHTRLAAGADWLDAHMLPRFPGLQRWCRYVVLTVRRDPS